MALAGYFSVGVDMREAAQEYIGNYAVSVS